MAPMISTNHEVASAVADGRPVVALESTIITHGMPYPANVETALGLEETVREGGAVPATIGVLDGRATVGLGHDELERLGRSGRAAEKVSRRDLGFVAAKGRDGGTTVAATMLLAERAGVRVFATGGIGGVHRGVETTWDISADLQELATSSVVVVCSGMKSILDLGRSLEVLETLSVPVVGFGTDELPAFYCRNSGHRVSHRVDSAAEVASLIAARQELSIEGGVVVANPIPATAAMESCAVESAIEQALGECERDGVRGKDITPYLLARVDEITGGASLAANIALVRDNARVASAIAVEMAR